MYAGRFSPRRPVNTTSRGGYSTTLTMGGGDVLILGFFTIG